MRPQLPPGWGRFPCAPRGVVVAPPHKFEMELNNSRLHRLIERGARMPSKNECVELEMKMMKAWQLARAVENTTRERFEAFAAELEQKLREIERVSHG
jgi:hypothetical protein